MVTTSLKNFRRHQIENPDHRNRELFHDLGKMLLLPFGLSINRVAPALELLVNFVLGHDLF